MIREGRGNEASPIRFGIPAEIFNERREDVAVLWNAA
jgi:hypothetical protein